MIFSDIVTFDNKYSWTNKKKLWYHIDVITPDETTSELIGKSESEASPIGSS